MHNARYAHQNTRSMSHFHTTQFEYHAVNYFLLFIVGFWIFGEDGKFLTFLGIFLTFYFLGYIWLVFNHVFVFLFFYLKEKAILS